MSLEKINARLEAALYSPMTPSHTLLLRNELLRSVSTSPEEGRRLRSLYKRAAENVPGILVRSALDPRLWAPDVKGLTPYVTLDKRLQPLYGHITSALDEVVAAGLPAEAVDFLLDAFRLDTPVYRVNVTAAIVVLHALHKADFRVTL